LVEGDELSMINNLQFGVVGKWGIGDQEGSNEVDDFDHP
jgi:hypothetical protein